MKASQGFSGRPSVRTRASRGSRSVLADCNGDPVSYSAVSDPARPPIGPGQSFNRQSQPAFVPLGLTAVHPPEKVIGPSDRSRKERSGEGTLTGLGDNKKYYISGQIL